MSLGEYLVDELVGALVIGQLERRAEVSRLVSYGVAFTPVVIRQNEIFPLNGEPRHSWRELTVYMREVPPVFHTIEDYAGRLDSCQAIDRA